MEEFVGLSILRIGKIISIFLETESCDDDDKWRLGKNTFELSKELYNERKKGQRATLMKLRCSVSPARVFAGKPSVMRCVPFSTVCLLNFKCRLKVWCK